MTTHIRGCGSAGHPYPGLRVSRPPIFGPGGQPATNIRAWYSLITQIRASTNRPTQIRVTHFQNHPYVGLIPTLIKSRFLPYTEEIVRTAQAWRTERTRWFFTRKRRNFLESWGRCFPNSSENFAFYVYKTSEFSQFSTPGCLQTCHVLVLYSMLRKISEICTVL